MWAWITLIARAILADRDPAQIHTATALWQNAISMSPPGSQARRAIQAASTSGSRNFYRSRGGVVGPVPPRCDYSANELVNITGDGGWGTHPTTTASFLDIRDEDFDDFDRRQLTQEEFIDEYVKKSVPVLFQTSEHLGTCSTSPWAREELLRTSGHAIVQVSRSNLRAPTTRRRGSSDAVVSVLALRDFVGQWDSGDVFDSTYVFTRPIPGLSLDVDPHPLFLSSAAKQFHFEMYHDLLFHIGNRGSGVYFHAHTEAYNSLEFGKKLWILFPPFMGFYRSGTQGTSQEWLHDFLRNESNFPRPMMGVQVAGETLFVPAGWLHATLCLQNCVGMAMEVGRPARQSAQQPTPEAGG